MRKKNIIHIVHNLQVGGVEAAVRSSIDKLNEEYNFWIVTLHHNNPDFIRNVKFKHRIVCFNLQNIFAPINLIRLLLFVVLKKPVILLASLWKSYAVTFFFALFNSKIQVISIIHNSKFFHSLDSVFSRLILKKSDLVLCDSNSSKKFIDSLFITTKTEVLSFKINDETMELKEDKVYVMNRFNAVFIGRLSNQKRIDRAVKLITLISEKGVNVSFDIYGPDHQMKDKLEQLISKKQLNINIYDAIAPDEVPHVLNKYNFFIQLSDVEGMAITVVQAMQQGLIPIVTAVGEMQFYVKHQQNGLVVNPPFDDLETIANQINEMVKLPTKMKQMSDAAKDTFVHQPLYADHLNQILKRQLEAK